MFEHPLVSIGNQQSRTKAGMKERSDGKRFFRVRIGTEVVVEKELGPRTFKIRIGDEVVMERKLNEKEARS